MEDFNHAHMNWVGVSAGDTETKFLDNINNCFLEKPVRDQKKKKTKLTLNFILNGACDLIQDIAFKGLVLWKSPIM